MARRTPSVKGTVADSGRDMPVIDTTRRRRRRIRVMNVSNSRGPGAGSPSAEHFNIFPFPFGSTRPARHGHHPLFPVGAARRVGAWRTGGTGTLGGNYKRRTTWG